jgi:hypothetical protein
MIHDCGKERQREIVGFAAGDFVMYTDEPSEEQVSWGGNDHPSHSGMKIGEVYECADVEIHDFHSCVRFRGFAGRFNSLSFTVVDPNDTDDLAEMKYHALGRAESERRRFPLA